QPHIREDNSSPARRRMFEKRSLQLAGEHRRTSSNAAGSKFKPTTYPRG
ncbi:MAG: hypothetical protein ACI9W2_001166, partial [Gammaproteobacteria bacterium]